MDLADGFARVWVDRFGLNAGDLAILMAHPDGLAMAYKLRARVDRTRDKNLGGVILCVIRAAHFAEAAADAAGAIMAERAAAPFEGGDAFLQKLIMCISARLGDLGDADQRLNLVVERVPGLKPQMLKFMVALPRF